MKAIANKNIKRKQGTNITKGDLVNVVDTNLVINEKIKDTVITIVTLENGETFKTTKQIADKYFNWVI